MSTRSPVQVNARVFTAGKWRGLDTIALRDSLQAINGIGHAAVMSDPEFRSALAAHGYTLTRDGEIEQLAPYVGAFSKRWVGGVAGLAARLALGRSRRMDSGTLHASSRRHTARR